MFRWGWNNHAVTTEHCKTPLQLFTTGALARGPQRQQYSSLNSQGSIENSSGVPVPRIVSPLSPTKETELRSLIETELRSLIILLNTVQTMELMYIMKSDSLQSDLFIFLVL